MKSIVTLMCLFAVLGLSSCFQKEAEMEDTQTPVVEQEVEAEVMPEEMAQETEEEMMQEEMMEETASGEVMDAQETASGELMADSETMSGETTATASGEVSADIDEAVEDLEEIFDDLLGDFE